MQIPDRNFKKYAIICGCMFVGGLVFAYAIFPPILKFILRSQVILKPGTQMRDMYDALPFPLIFKVYLFHVENPDEVHTGGKPAFREIGPFVFEEWKEKVDQVEDFDADTLEFTEKKTFIFSPELSAPLTGDEELTMIHPLLSGIPLTVNVDRAPMLPLISKAVDLIFHSPQHMFWTGRAMDIMFDGILLDCSSSDFNSKAACSVFEGGEVKAVWPADEPESHFKFAIFGGVNGTDGDRFKTFKGIKKLRDLGRVIEFNEEPELDVWEGDECNQLRGTEGSIFPPFNEPDDPIWAFEAGICRSMQSRFDRPSKYSGLPTSHHVIEIGDIAADESQHCYCTDGECPAKGTMDLFPCMGSPLVASMPHFLHADPKFIEAIKSGMEPDREKHIIYIDMETISGTPLSAAKRMQFNMELKPLEQIAYMKEVPEMLFPMMWIEEGANLNKTFVNMLKYQLFLGLKFRATVKWICLLVGSIGGIASTILHLKKAKDQQNEITKVPDTTEVKGGSSAADVESAGQPTHKPTSTLNEKLALGGDPRHEQQHGSRYSSAMRTFAMPGSATLDSADGSRASSAAATDKY